MSAHAGVEPRPWRDRRVLEDARDHRRRLSRGRAGLEFAAIQLGLSHDVVYPVPEGIKHRVPEPDADHHLRHRQAARRAGCRRDPRFPPAGALQGQGHQDIRANTYSARKARRSNGAGNEQHGEKKLDKDKRRKACACVKTLRKRVSRGSGAVVRVFRSVQEHLCAGNRRQARGALWRLPRRIEKDLRGKSLPNSGGNDTAAASEVGKLIAERAKQGRCHGCRSSTAADICIMAA